MSIMPVHSEKETLEGELINLFITSQEVRIEIGKLKEYVSDAQENLRRAEVEKFCFITDYDTAHKIALLNHAYSMENVKQAPLQTTSDASSTRARGESRKPASEESGSSEEPEGACFTVSDLERMSRHSTSERGSGCSAPNSERPSWHTAPESPQLASLQAAPCKLLTEESWKLREPTQEELESFGSVSTVEIVDKNSGAILMLDSYSDSIKPLKEESLRQCIQELGQRVTLLKTERQERIDSLARIRFNAHLIRDYIRLYTPEQERLLKWAPPHYQTSQRPLPPLTAPDQLRISQAEIVSSPPSSLVSRGLSWIGRGVSRFRENLSSFSS